MWLFRPDRSNTEGWLNVEQTIIKRKVNWIFSLGSSLVVSVNYSPHRVQGQIGRISQMSVHAAVFTVQQTARLRAKTTTFTPSCVCLCSAWHVVTAGLCHRAAPRPCGNIFFAGCGGGFTWGLILWWRKGAKETRHTLWMVTEFTEIKYVYEDDGEWTLDWHRAASRRQLVDVFAAPPYLCETKQCEVMSLLPLMQTSCVDRMGSLGFKEIVLACSCTVHVCRVQNSPHSYNFIWNKMNLKTTIFVKKKFISF